MYEDKIKYQGPNRTYTPPIGQIRAPESNTSAVVPSEGYHDMEELKRQLDFISKISNEIYRLAEAKLSSFALEVDQSNADFVTAHDLVYPNDQTPGYVTFDEYKYLLLHGDSSAAQYIKGLYEAKARGPMGTNALDVSNIALIIHTECKRIHTFIDTYIGELDETAEFRTVELFQDWATDTQVLVQKLAKAIQGKIKAQIPGPELDSLSKESATNSQVVFHTKINQLNSILKNMLADLEKKWNKPSDPFYNQVLGPALLFQIKFANQISDPVQVNKMANEAPTIFKEVEKSIKGLSNNFVVAISDQLRRNKIFEEYVSNFINNMAQRDFYVEYSKQLAQKGKALKNYFVNSESVTQAQEIKDSAHPIDEYSARVTASTLRPSHTDLIDRDSDDAHPQYLLKNGGTITGDIIVDEGVTIDGIDLDLHDHDGVNSARINGNNIEWGTLTAQSVDTSTSESMVPTDLKVVSARAELVSPGEKKLNVVISYEVDVSEVVGYEFEIIKVDS